MIKFRCQWHCQWQWGGSFQQQLKFEQLHAASGPGPGATQWRRSLLSCQWQWTFKLPVDGDSGSVASRELAAPE